MVIVKSEFHEKDPAENPKFSVSQLGAGSPPRWRGGVRDSQLPSLEVSPIGIGNGGIFPFANAGRTQAIRQEMSKGRK